MTSWSPAAVRSAWPRRCTPHRAGLAVVVREPRAGPIDKACGEGLMPGAVAELVALDVHPHGRELAGIRYLDGRRGRERAVPPRARAWRAPDRCCTTRWPSGRRRGRHRRRARARGRDAGRRRPRSTASGSAPRRRRRPALAGAPPRRARRARRRRRRFGLRCHVQQAPWSSYVEVHWSPRAEAYVTPVDDDLVGVAVLGAAGSRFEELIDDFPLLQQRLTGQRTRVMGAGPLRQRARSRSAGRVLLVGDAAGPFLATVAMWDLPHGLTPGSRRQDHTTSPYAVSVSPGAEHLTSQRPSHPAPTCRDDRDTSPRRH